MQYTSIKKNKCVPKKLQFTLVWNYTKNRTHKEKNQIKQKLPSCSESQHLLA